MLVYERSWATFALVVGAWLLVRPLLGALQAAVSWPATPATAAPARPAFTSLWARSLAFDVAVGALLAPFALMVVALGAFPVSWLFFAAVPPVLVLSVLLFDGWLVPGSWRAGRRSAQAGALVALAAVMSAAAALASLGAAGAFAAAVLAGLAEAAAWWHLVRWLAGARPVAERIAPAHPLWRSPPAIAAAFLGVAVGGAAAGFAVATHAAQPGSGASVLAARRLVASRRAGTTAVVVVEGYSSRYDGSPPTLPSVPPPDQLVEFSYAGLTRTGAPAPYGPAATHSSLARLAGLLARQVAGLRAVTGRSVDLIGVSEGSAVVEAYLAERATVPVGAVVLVSPLLEPGRVSFPAPGSTGWGMVAGRGLQELGSWLGRISSHVDLAPGQPFLRSLIADGARLAAGRPGARPPRELAILPIADAVTGAAPDVGRGVEVAVVPAFHGGNLGDPSVAALISEELSGRPLRSDGGDVGVDRAIAALCSAWVAPSSPAR
jgi:hypothetical protein